MTSGRRQRRNSRNPTRLYVAALLVASTACTARATDLDSSDSEIRPTVVAAFYPIEQIISRVGGTAIDTATLVPPGKEAHEYEPTAQQLAGLNDADLVFFLGADFQPSVEKAIGNLPESVTTIDLLQGLELVPLGSPAEASYDPHVWLDPANMITMVQSVTDALILKVPTFATTFESNAAKFIGELATLDREFETGLFACASRVLITTHQAFGYLALAYQLEQISIAGVSPGDEPSAKSLQQVIAAAKQAGVGTIFYEANLPDDLAETVANELDVATAKLDTGESDSSSQVEANGYIGIMRANLAALREGLACQ